MDPQAYYYAPSVENLQVLLEEVTRAKPGSPETRFVRPEDETVRALSSEFHHVLYGRRGTGKSSLLRHIESELKRAGGSVAWIDQETFKALSYPDVLVGAMSEIFNQFSEQISQSSPLEKKKWYQLRSPKLSTKQQLAKDLQVASTSLEELKRMPSSSEVEWTESYADERSARSGHELSGGAGYKAVSVAGKKSSSRAETESRNSAVAHRYTALKSEHLERAVSTYRDLFVRIGKATDGAYIVLDDFYHLNLSDQPSIAGYFHRAVKDSGVWLKFGSITLWTRLYAGGTPPIGMQTPHDLKDRSLDRNLQQFSGAKRFLEGILSNLANECKVEVDKLFTAGALDRLILASGGVPRDYISLVGLSIDEAKGRGPSAKAGSDRVIAEDVNKAAGRTLENKISDLKEDAGDAWVQLLGLVNDLTTHCRNSKSACFLIDASNVALVNDINRLQNMRFVHHVASNETLPNQQSARYNVYVLDVSQLAAQRAWQVDFMGWTKREGRRAKKLIFRPGSVNSAPKKIDDETLVVEDDNDAIVDVVE